MSAPQNQPSSASPTENTKDKSRGKLKIFLGAAPGVGKTYSMLSAARIHISEGIDTVIGLVETHDRKDTQALAEGIGVIPRQKIEYRGLKFEEMNVDAILKRKPKLVLIDELDHANVPGSKHPKRYHDVQELLEAGIDVYSTLNVQYIESLNDVVAKITGIKVKDTVPDSIVRAADSIELIDLPTEELLQRLKDGKIHIPEESRTAVHRIFTHGNLTALRELALREAAERVDDQMSSYMRRNSISGPWPVSDRIMVCITDDVRASSLVRAANRQAERKQTPWMAVYVMTADDALNIRKGSNAMQAMDLAEKMGAETITITSENPASEILRIAQERNVGTIIAGKSKRGILSRLLRSSVTSAIMKNGSGFDMLLIDGIAENASQASNKRQIAINNPGGLVSKSSILKTVFTIGIASLAAILLREFTSPICVPFVYLSAILFIALDMELASVILATVLSTAAQYVMMTFPDILFLPARIEDILLLCCFFALSLLIGIVGDKLQHRIKLASRNAERAQSLYDFTKGMAAAATADDIAQTTVRRISSALGCHALILMPKNNRLEIIAANPLNTVPDKISLEAMDWAWKHGKPAGFKSDTLPNAEFFAMPLMSGGVPLGILAVKIKDGKSLSTEQHHFLSGLSYQSASAIDRARLVTDIEQARLQSETERLRASLLSSVSKDLRAPMENIKQTAIRLESKWSEIFPDQKHLLIQHIVKEADKLDRFIENLLDMTGLVTENLKLSKSPTSVKELINNALARLSSLISERIVNIDCPENLIRIEADNDVMTRVFINLIENACMYSTPDQPINISASQEGNEIRISVTDKGPGIPESERQRVFDMFYKIKTEDPDASSVTGVGLGLSICRGFVEAHGGHIKALAGENNVGTSIVIHIPTAGKNTPPYAA